MSQTAVGRWLAFFRRNFVYKIRFSFRFWFQSLVFQPTFRFTIFILLLSFAFQFFNIRFVFQYFNFQQTFGLIIFGFAIFSFAFQFQLSEISIFKILPQIFRFSLENFKAPPLSVPFLMVFDKFCQLNRVETLFKIVNF